MAWRYRWSCLLVLLSQFALLLLSMAIIALTGLGIDTLRHAVDPSAPVPRWLHLLPAPAASQGAHGPILWIALALLTAGLARMLLAALNGIWSGNLLQGRLVRDLRTECYDKLQRLSFRFFDAQTSGSLINRIAGDIQSTRLFLDGVLFQVLTLLVTVAVSIGYMLALNARLTLACLATSPAVWLVTTLFSKRVQPAYKEASELNDRLSQKITESLRGIHVLKAFGRESDALQGFHLANDSLRDKQQQIFLTISTFVPSILFLSQTSLIVLLTYGGLLSAKGNFPVGTGLVAFAALLQQVATQVAGIGNIANTAQQSLRAARRVFEILDAPPSLTAPPNAPPPRAGTLRFESVSFSHSGQPVLSEISLEARPGDCIALVGPTGSGKSSLLSLIPRFYDPGSGRITLSGRDLRELDLGALRRSVGVVFQESFLFSTTIAANIAFGHPEADRNQIERAARTACAHEFIAQLPDGYDTVLGEAGIGLSGGQRQRLSIARALLTNPALLILDDPTAAVDPGTESEILEALESAMSGRTTFLVAHRPAMLRKATRILVLENGRIVQEGTHHSLLAQPGYYRDSLLAHSRDPSPA